MSIRAREIHLASRPHGEPTADNFAFVDVDVPDPADGEVQVRNLFLSVDPYMRGRMNDAKSYVAPYRLGEVMSGGAVGEVVASRADGFAEGDVVVHQAGWREYVVGDAAGFRRVDPTIAPSPSVYLGVLGSTGLTAHVGLFEMAAMRPGDVVFVSGAAGAVGSVVGQIAKLRGASRVVGSAGGAEKIAHVTEDLGFDAAFDYKRGRVAKQLAAAAPDGIDVYFDNVGGEHLEAAIWAMNDFGRIAACGAVSSYNATELMPGPRNLFQIVQKRLSIRGFIITDHVDLWSAAARDLAGWVRDGALSYRETVVDGFDNAPDAFISLLRGANTGKMVVRLS